MANPIAPASIQKKPRRLSIVRAFFISDFRKAPFPKAIWTEPKIGLKPMPIAAENKAANGESKKADGMNSAERSAPVQFVEVFTDFDENVMASVFRAFFPEEDRKTIRVNCLVVFIDNRLHH